MGRKGAKGGAGAASTPALAAVAAAGVVHHAHSYESRSDDYGAEAAHEMGRALGIDAERVFKTLVVRTARPAAGSRSTLAVAVLPVTSRLDLKAAAAALGCGSCAMADVTEAERATGYVVGGVSPLGQRRALPTVVDSSALDHATVFVSAGRRGLEVELAPADLVALTSASTAVIRSPATG